MMKKMVLTCLASASLLSAPAQLFSPEAFGGAALGAMLGGIAGGNSYSHGCHSYNSFSGEGAAIGAGVGLLVGALTGEANRRQAYAAEPVAYAPAPSVSLGYGYAHGGNSAYVQVAPSYYAPPAYAYPSTRPNYAVNGTLLGAASGALIGSGSHDAGKGAAIGAVSGLVLGGLAEHAARKQEKRYAATQPVAQTQARQPAPSAPPPDASAQSPNLKAEITSQPCPGSTYYWTTPPQIPDAGRVPDAPRF